MSAARGENIKIIPVIGVISKAAVNSDLLWILTKYVGSTTVTATRKRLLKTMAIADPVNY